MKEHRLLDRIRLLDKNPARRITEDPKQVIRSVQEHLQRILNTRRGSVPIAEEYGVPDFTNYMSNYPESQRTIERELKQTIQRFEPRMKGIRVTFLPQDEDLLTVSFQIVARLVLEDQRDPITFESLLDSSGHIRVKG